MLDALKLPFFLCRPKYRTRPLVSTLLVGCDLHVDDKVSIFLELSRVAAPVGSSGFN